MIAVKIFFLSKNKIVLDVAGFVSTLGAENTPFQQVLPPFPLIWYLHPELLMPPALHVPGQRKISRGANNSIIPFVR